MKKLNIKALLIDHGEKLVFGLFGLIILGILGPGTSWGRYNKTTPDALKGSAEAAKSKITSNNPWPKDKEESFKVIDFSEKSNQLFTMPAVAQYDFSQWLFHPLYKKDEPKREPLFETVQNLIVKSAFVPLSVLSDDARKMMENGSATEGVESEAGNELTQSSDEFELRSGAGTGPNSGRGAFDGDGPQTSGRAPAMIGPPASGSTKSGNANKTPSLGAAAGKNRPGASGAMGPGAMGAMGPGAMAGMNPGAMGAMGAGLLGASRMGPGAMMGSGGMMGSGMSGAGSGVTVRGHRVMAVRGVFPIQKQIENYRNALHVTQEEALDLLEITDFVLERQTALAGPDPWKESPWVTVNIESALEVLGECSDLDAEDPVPTALRDSVITMDLPMNLLGIWKEYATHPLIKNEELSPEAIEEEAKLLEKVNETFESANLTDPSQPRRRGLAAKQRDFNKMVNQVNSNPESRGMMEQMMKGSRGAAGPGMGSMSMGSMGMGSMGAMGGRVPDTDGAMSSMMMGPGGKMGAGGRMGPAGMGRGMQGSTAIDRLVARRKYLLFRYFDFDVEFGMAYRYRVKLVLRNPNFERPADELGDIEIAKGEERETPWSNISNPDVVRNKVGYYLKDVEREPYYEDKVKPSTRPVALLSMYEWDTAVGAVFNDVLNLTAIGGFIGEKKKSTTIPDLVAGTMEKGEHEFLTQDALLDVEADADVTPDQHPDLRLSPDKGRSNARLGLVEEVLIVTALGELKTLGQPMNDSDKDSLRHWRQREELEHKVIKSRESTSMATQPGTAVDDEQQFKQRSNPRRGPMGAAGGSNMGSMMMPGGMGSGSAPRGANQPRRGRPGGGGGGDAGQGK